jgi:hypothetical protein
LKAWSPITTQPVWMGIGAGISGRGGLVGKSQISPAFSDPFGLNFEKKLIKTVYGRFLGKKVGGLCPLRPFWAKCESFAFYVSAHFAIGRDSRPFVAPGKARKRETPGKAPKKPVVPFAPFGIG